MRISFIGFGNMAKAIAKGLLQYPQYQISAASPSLTKGINSDGINTHSDNRMVLKEADIVFLAVKPAKMAEVLAEIKESIPDNCLVVSIAAGKTLSWIEEHCCKGQAIVRSMPNTPIAQKIGATPLIANTHVNPQQKEDIAQLFKSLGIIAWVEQESDMDIFTALSGSGPAYVYLFLEAMANAATQLGLSNKLAKTFALQTIKGAVEVARESSLDTGTLLKTVTSPNGTTAKALQVLEKGQFEQTLHQAMFAACERAKELAQS